MLNRGQHSFRPRTEWTREDLESDANLSAQNFRKERLEEPVEAYSERFEAAQDTIEDFLEETLDLLALDNNAAALLASPTSLDAFRYLAGPPISIDDLKTLAETNSLAPARLTGDPKLVARLIQTIRIGLDRHRFPWVNDKREPTPSEREASVIASAALMATQMVATSRRNEAKQFQEEQVRQALRDYGLTEASNPAHAIPTLHHAPDPGSFHPNETLLGSKKADLVVRLWDGRIMPIECKVSNSSTNSIKRLNGDAAVKAHEWLSDFGKTQVVPVAVLSGVYKLRNLTDAQERGLTLYWAHRLDDLTTWIESTR